MSEPLVPLTMEEITALERTIESRIPPSEVEPMHRMARMARLYAKTRRLKNWSKNMCRAAEAENPEAFDAAVERREPLKDEQ